MSRDLTRDTLKALKMVAASEPDERRRRLLRASANMLERAIAAKERGAVKDFVPVMSATDPMVIDHIQFLAASETPGREGVP